MQTEPFWKWIIITNTYSPFSQLIILSVVSFAPSRQRTLSLTRILRAYPQMGAPLEIITRTGNPCHGEFLFASFNWALDVSDTFISLASTLPVAKHSPPFSELWICPFWWQSCVLFLEQMGQQLGVPWIFKRMIAIPIDLLLKRNHCLLYHFLLQISTFSFPSRICPYLVVGTNPKRGILASRVKCIMVIDLWKYIPPPDKVLSQERYSILERGTD